jgi:mRNA-degrading endonuclease toxin of MazEF toxin-antitoxin module
LKQYEVWWANLPAPAGKRPVLLLTRDSGYEYLNKFIAAEITTTIRHIRQEVLLGPKEGLTKLCAANLDNVRTISKTALAKRAGALAAGRHAEVKQALGYALGWRELMGL